LDNYLLSNALPSVESSYTAHTSFTIGTNKVKPFNADEQTRRGCYWEIGRVVPANGSTSFATRRSLVNRPDLGRMFGIGYGFNQDPYHNYGTGFTSYPETFIVRRDETTGGSQVINDQPQDGTDPKSNSWEVRDFVIGTQGNVGGTSVRHKLLGEYWESIHFTRDLTQDEESKLSRYLQYKWYGTKQY